VNFVGVAVLHSAVAIWRRNDLGPAMLGHDALGLMGGGGRNNWGVIDAMRRKADNLAKRSSFLSDEMMDRQANSTGAHWNGHDYVTGEAPEFRITHSDVRKLSSVLTPKEKLVVRLGLYEKRILSLPKLHAILVASGFGPAEVQGMMQRAAAKLIGHIPILQQQIADILGLKTDRQVRNLKRQAFEKLRIKYSALLNEEAAE
jgi:hypothetical protein